MITTGLIREINTDTGTSKANKCVVEIDYFKTPADKTSDNYKFQANICNPGGLYSSYKVGDLVYVGFINNDYSLPVILGHIYQGLSEEYRSFANLDALKVSGNIELSKDIKIGSLTYNELLKSKLYQYCHLGYITDANDDIRIYYNITYEDIFELDASDKMANKILNITDLKEIFQKSLDSKRQKALFVGNNNIKPGLNIEVISTQFITRETVGNIVVWYVDLNSSLEIQKMIVDSSWNVFDTLSIKSLNADIIK